MACERSGGAFGVRARSGVRGAGEAAVVGVLPAAGDERTKTPAARAGRSCSGDLAEPAGDVWVSAGACDAAGERDCLQSEDGLGGFETERLAVHGPREDKAAWPEPRRPSGGVGTESAVGIGFHMDSSLEWGEGAVGRDH